MDKTRRLIYTLPMHKFSIVSYFDDKTTKEVREIQEKMSEITGSLGALVAWTPHITVGSGVSVEENQIEDFYQNIGDFLSDFRTTSLKTKEFSFMDNWSGSKLGFTPYVVYIKPFDYGTLSAAASFFEEQIKPRYPVWYDQPWP